MNTPPRSRTLLALLALLAPCADGANAPVFSAEKEEKAKPQPQPFVSIFNGKNLDSWVHDSLGKATYEVVDGTIVGTTVEGSPNSFLLSEKEYGDFELKFEVKVDNGLNSGVQIRSREKTDADVPESERGRKNSAAGRVFGPQVEIEMSPGQAGYIYGEATGFGWLSPEPGDKDHAHEHVVNGEWNKFRVLARGPRIQTWINGKPVADLTHEEIYKTHPKGHIGLQVHGIKPGTGPFSVRWRKLEVRELPVAGKAKAKAKAKAKPSVRKDLPGGYYAFSPDPEVFTVAGNGDIAIRGGGGYLWTQKSYGDVEIDLEVKMSEGCNSGVFLRTDPQNPVQGGFEIQVFDSAGKEEVDKHDFGAFYDAVAPLVNAAKPAGEWNHMVIRWVGPMLTVEVNDRKVQDLNVDDWTTANMNPDGSKNKFGTALKDLPRTGHVGFQNHGHDVWFRNVSIKGL